MSWNCQKCGYPNTDNLDECFRCNTARVDPTPSNPPPPQSDPSTASPIQPPQQPVKSTKQPAATLLGVFATLLVVIGAGMVLYFMLFFDTSVAVPDRAAFGIESGRINNIGLMSDKQNGLICGFGFALFGVILGLWDHFTRMKK